MIVYNGRQGQPSISFAVFVDDSSEENIEILRLCARMNLKAVELEDNEHRIGDGLLGGFSEHGTT